MDSQVEILISEVQKKPILYNMKDKNHRNRLLVDKAWEIVASKVEMPSKLLYYIIFQILYIKQTCIYVKYIFIPVQIFYFNIILIINFNFIKKNNNSIK